MRQFDVFPNPSPRSRAAAPFMVLMQSHFMDEMPTALSPSRQLSFLARLHQLVNARSQFIIATHSPIILGYPDAWIYQTSAQGLERVAYEDTEHYQVTRGFLSRPQTYLDVLLADD